MRHKDQAMKDRMVKEIEAHLKRYSCSPTLQELADLEQVDVSTISRYVKALIEDGRLVKDGLRTVRPTHWGAVTSAFRMIPKTSFVACGPLQEVDGRVEEYIAVPELMLENGEDYFIVEAAGESMIEAGIADGDRLLICRTAQCRPKDIVVALVENATTLKRYLVDENNVPYLHPENRTMTDIYPDTLIIQGVMVGLYRKYKRH